MTRLNIIESMHLIHTVFCRNVFNSKQKRIPKPLQRHVSPIIRMCESLYKGTCDGYIKKTPGECAGLYGVSFKTRRHPVVSQDIIKHMSLVSEIDDMSEAITVGDINLTEINQKASLMLAVNQETITLPGKIMSEKINRFVIIAHEMRNLKTEKLMIADR